MNKLNSFRRTTAAVLTVLLIIAIAAPLLSFASAAPVASLSKTSGPNGTVISVSGTGFGANEAVGAISVSVDGHAAGLNVITTSAVVAGFAPDPSIKTDFRLATNASGALSGNIILYGLALGAHTVIISDATTSVVAGTFTVTTPSVTVSPATVAAGASVIVTGSGFPSAGSLSPASYSNKIASAAFSGNTIAVTTGSYTSSPSTLSSDAVNSKATVSLPAVTAAGPVFTLTDLWGNVATTTLSLGATTVTLSPSSGPVGTVVTATLTGFGQTATIASVVVGNVVGSTSPATIAPAVPPVTEQGTSVFVFTVPEGTTTTLAGVAGAQAVTVTDSKGNVGTATFTVTPKVTLSLGAATVDSHTTYAPIGTASAQIFVTATGFKASSALTITASPLVPSAWITPSATWTLATGTTYSATTGRISTDANGAVGFTSDQASTPASAGQYSITISDGTTSVSTIITMTALGSIVATNVNAPSSGAISSSVVVSYFGATPGAILFDNVAVTTGTLTTASAWPVATTVTITVPSAASGLHQISATGFNSVPFTVVAPTITVVSPSSAAVGTTVIVVGSGFATDASAVVSIQGATVAGSASKIVGNTLIATFTVPNYLPGSYTLTLSDLTNTAATTLNVAAAQIQISPTTSTLGTTAKPVTLEITGSGFAAGETFTVIFDSTTITADNPGTTAVETPVGLTVINTNGGILISSGYVIPTAATAGPHTVTVIGAHGAWATATFTIQPKLATLGAVRPDSKVTITGNGFAANSLETLTVNGTATTWLDTTTSPASALGTGVTVVTDPSGNLRTGVGFNVSATTPAGILVIVVTDASGNTATVNLTILGTPAIVLGASNIVAGLIPTQVSISGSGFTPGTRSISAGIYNGATLVSALAYSATPPSYLSATSVAVDTDGTFKGISFKVPASVAAGTYTLQLTATSPSETASATITVMGTPSIVAPTTAKSSSNVSITITGLSAVSTASFGGIDLIATTAFGPTTIAAKGASAFTTTTSFIVPPSIFAGTYLLTITDSNTGLMVQTAITVGPSMDVTPATGSKGTTITATATGFAALSAVTAKVNGAAITLSTSTTSSTGGLSATFAIPLTAAATNTLTVTDASGNVATATFTLTIPVIALTPTSVSVGNTVQVIGTGFKANSPIVFQLAGQIVLPVPATLAAASDGSFIGYLTVPAGLNGNVTVTATDTSNNVGTAYLSVGMTTPFTLNTAAMASSAQTLNGAGIPATTFTSGSSVKVSFVLQSTTGSGNVVAAVTFQQGAKVYNMASAPAAISTTPSTVAFTNLLPAGATGTWTATLQVYASDGVTPLGVSTLSFTVS